MYILYCFCVFFNDWKDLIIICAGRHQTKERNWTGWLQIFNLLVTADSWYDQCYSCDCKLYLYCKKSFIYGMHLKSIFRWKRENKPQRPWVLQQLHQWTKKPWYASLKFTYFESYKILCSKNTVNSVLYCSLCMRFWHLCVQLIRIKKFQESSLMHFDTPQVLDDEYGSWLNPKIVLVFSYFPFCIHFLK